MGLQDEARHMRRSKYAPSDEAIGAYYTGMRPFWFPVLPSEDLAEKPVAIELLGEWIALARLEGEVGQRSAGAGAPPPQQVTP